MSQNKADTTNPAFEPRSLSERPAEPTNISPTQTLAQSVPTSMPMVHVSSKICIVYLFQPIRATNVLQSSVQQVYTMNRYFESIIKVANHNQ